MGSSSSCGWAWRAHPDAAARSPSGSRGRPLPPGWGLAVPRGHQDLRRKELKMRERRPDPSLRPSPPICTSPSPPPPAPLPSPSPFPSPPPSPPLPHLHFPSPSSSPPPVPCSQSPFPPAPLPPLPHLHFPSPLLPLHRLQLSDSLAPESQEGAVLLGAQALRWMLPCPDAQIMDVQGRLGKLPLSHLQRRPLHHLEEWEL